MAKKKKKSSVTKYVIGAAAIAIVGFGAYSVLGNKSTSKTDDKGQVLNWTLPVDITTVDISKNTDMYSSTIIGNTGSNLLRMDKDGKPVPDLAEKISNSKDGLTYEVTLKDGLKWSDGSDLTAEDFVYSWQRLVNPKTASEYAYLASGVKNADAITEGKAKVDELGVKADGNKITFTLEHPMPQFEYLLTFTNFMPQSKKFVEKEGDKYGTNSDTQIYSGPYKFEGWNGTNGTFKIVKNEKYWDAKNVKVSEVNFEVIKQPENAVQLFKQGKLDYAPIATPDLYNANKENESATYIAEARTNYVQYLQNGKNKALANKKIREALNLATNRDELVNQVTSGVAKAATGLAPTELAKTESGKDLSEYVKQPYTYDAKKAKELWTEGLKEIGESSVTLTFTADADRPETKSSVEYLVGAWENVLPGLKVEQKFVPFKQRLQDQQNQNFELVMSGWGGDYPEGSTFYGMFPTGAPYNNGQFSNKTYDDVYKAATTKDALDGAAKDDDYKNAEKALYDESNINPLFWKGSYALVNKDVKGVIYATTGLNVDFKDAEK
ncbi:ABC transporter substrate-binding protein [Floricoccus tropicus]|uniref:ABC transporter substrate-binding protein n=1 Tax=Floricoccus tropicus TaxID=1859473 RepID=A0A1E8GLS0_9LACT|nr:peptide ABC transporter substrate-binding protein [Floricoccus tropicus]OFI48458.1 ABC transporter substrate-binding protein [Floricoccus tropicus]